MEAVITYLIRVSASICLIHLFYLVALSRLTFYQWNRFYLLALSLLSFLFPFIDLSVFFDRHPVVSQDLLTAIPAIKFQVAPADPLKQLYQVIIYSIVLGVLLCLARLAMQYYSLLRIRRGARLIHKEELLRVYTTTKDISPFSFGGDIFISELGHTGAELESIVLHEIVHVKQKHTIDLIAAELMCVLNWYNPFAWMVRRAIRENLEFIADRKVLEQGQDRKEYQYFLLKVLGSGQFAVGNHFNISNLKKRIIMMNKGNSARAHLSRFLFAAPLLVVILLSFREQLTSAIQPIREIREIDTVPKAKPVEPVKPSPQTKVKPVPAIAGKPLVIIDGIEQPAGFDPHTIPESAIESISVWKDSGAVKKYGTAGKNGVLEIRTAIPGKNGLIEKAERAVTEPSTADLSSGALVFENKDQKYRLEFRRELQAGRQIEMDRKRFETDDRLSGFDDEIETSSEFGDDLNPNIKLKFKGKADVRVDVRTRTEIENMDIEFRKAQANLDKAQVELERNMEKLEKLQKHRGNDDWGPDKEKLEEIKEQAAREQSDARREEFRAERDAKRQSVQSRDDRQDHDGLRFRKNKMEEKKNERGLRRERKKERRQKDDK